MPKKSPDEEKNSIIWHQSGINPKGEPFVQLLRNQEIVGQFTPELAREHAQQTLEAAEAAEQDAFMWDFAKTKLGVDSNQAFTLIMEFRKYRQQKTGKSQGPTQATDWIFPQGE